MTGSHPHPNRPPALAALLTVLFLWSCTAEPTSKAPTPQGGPAQPATTAGPGGNHPPVINSAGIYPVDVSLDTELRINVEGEDRDGDRVSYRYQWLVNDLPVAGATEPQFKTEQLKNGDRIAAQVIPNDGKAEGPVFKADPVTVGNTPPDIAEIHLEPVPVHRGEQLKVKVVAGDADGDPVTLTYKWFRNDKEIPGAKTDTLETKDFRKNDILAVLVTPSDGKATREGRGGLPVTIENSAPRFTSSPPVEIKDGQYTYQVVVTDPDEDPVTLELKQGPPGMALDPATKQLVWKLTPENLGKHRVVLAAKDNENAVTQQEFDLDAQPPATAAQQ
jgi:hypothetical protein